MTASFPCFLLFTAVIKEDPPVTAHLMKETVDEPEGVTRLLLVNQLLIRKEMAAGLTDDRSYAVRIVHRSS